MKGQKISLGFLFGFAIKNLGRYKKRTLITASAIAFGLMLFIFIDGMLYGVDVDSQRNFVELETGAILVVDDNYLEEKDFLPLDYTIAEPSKVIEKLKNAGYTATPRIPFSVDMVFNENPFPTYSTKRGIVTGVDPATVQDVFLYNGKLTEGRFMEAGKYEVVIGSWLADDIGAKVGYDFTLSCDAKPVITGGRGTQQAIEVTIVGIIKTDNPKINKTGIFMPIDVVQKALRMSDETIELNIALPFYEDLDYHAAQLEKILDSENSSLDVVSWKEWAADFVAINAAKRQGTSAILFLVFLIAAVGISNTILMALYERRKEIGMMRAIGFQDRDIFWSFLFEAGGIGILGSIAGIIMGALINIYMVNWGIDFGFIIKDMDIGYRIAGVMRSMWNPSALVAAGLSGFCMAVVIAFFPTRKALSLTITECIRTE